MVFMRRYKPKNENILKLKKYVKDGNKARVKKQLHSTNGHCNT